MDFPAPLLLVPLLSRGGGLFESFYRVTREWGSGLLTEVIAPQRDPRLQLQLIPYICGGQLSSPLFGNLLCTTVLTIALLLDKNMHDAFFHAFNPAWN